MSLPKSRARRAALSLLLATVLCTALVPGESLASEGGSRPDEIGGKTFDLLVLRPAGILRAGFGTVYLVAAAPFALPNGSLDDVTNRLVVDPAKDTFQRELGDF